MAGFGIEYMKGETGSGSGKPSSPPSLEKESGEENMELGMIRSELIDCLSDDDVIGLLYYLRMMNVLNDQEMKTVEGKMTSKDRAHFLIDTVMRKGERASSLMVDYLTERHPDLCWTLGLTPTSARIKLGRIGSELIDRLSDDDVIGLLHYLRKMDGLNDDDMKTVEEKMTSKDRARCLIDTVMRKGERKSRLMVKYLSERHPDLCSTLGLTPTSARIIPSAVFDEEDEGTSLTEDKASMSLMDRHEEEDGSDSVLSFFPGASAEIDEDDEEDEEEMHVKSLCEKCKASQQSPEYEKVTPTKISKWSFEVQLEGEGTYECSATGLVFEVSEQALVRYSVLSWFQFSEFLGDSWRPAGSIYDVDVVDKDPSSLNKDSSVLKFIHFPHSLCLAEPEHELSFRVLHVKDGQASIELTVGFTESHVKWRVSSLSPGGVIIPSSLQGKHDGAVLVYKEGNHKYFSGSEIQAIEEQVNKYRKKCIKMDKPAVCNSKLVAGKNYHLTSEPEGKVEPSELNFNTDVIGLKGFSEARFDKQRKNCDKPLWSATITEEDLNSEEPNIGQKGLMTSGSSGEGSLSMSEPSSPMDLGSSSPHERSRITHGLVQNRSKPVKKKSSCSSGQGSPPGESSSSPPLKMPKSDDTLDTNRGQALSGRQLLQVAQTLGQEWRRAGVYLDLSTTDLDDIKAEEADVIMQKVKMLERWQRRTPGKATAQDLLRGLQGLKDLPVDTRQLLTDWINGSLTQPDH